MADNKNFDEEYQYVEEPDAASTAEPEPVINPSAAAESEYSEKLNSMIQQPNVRRNAIIAVLGLFILIGVLKCTSKGDIPQKEASKPQAIGTQTKSANLNPLTSVQQQELEANTQVEHMQHEALDKINGLSAQVNQLSAQVAQLSQSNQAMQQQISDLLEKIQMNQQVMQEWIASNKTKAASVSRPHHAYVKKAPVQRLKFYVRAIVPGRAWLMSTQGKTMTVRVGSQIPSYGTVKSIDAPEGRVKTSSGREIVFNQEE